MASFTFQACLLSLTLFNAPISGEFSSQSCYFKAYKDGRLLNQTSCAKPFDAVTYKWFCDSNTNDVTDEYCMTVTDCCSVIDDSYPNLNFLGTDGCSRTDYFKEVTYSTERSASTTATVLGWRHFPIVNMTCHLQLTPKQDDKCQRTCDHCKDTQQPAVVFYQRPFAEVKVTTSILVTDSCTM
jgi:hypothetical protein